MDTRYSPEQLELRRSAAALVDDLGPRTVDDLDDAVRRGRLDDAALRDAGIAGAYAIADHAGSVQLAIDDAANQLAGLSEVTAAGLGNSGTTRYR